MSFEDTIRQIIREEVASAVQQMEERIKNSLADDDEMLTVDQAAKYLGYSRSYVYELAKRSDFPATKITPIRIPKWLLRRWAEENCIHREPA